MVKGKWGPQRIAIEKRFWNHVVKTDYCWYWVGARRGRGYGTAKIDGHLKQAHRVAYSMIVGPIRDGMTLDHLCRNKLCVNPRHLEQTTMAVNVARSNKHRAVLRSIAKESKAAFEAEKKRRGGGG
jgi:hypothetical protein